MLHLLSLAIQHDQDVVTARQRAAHITQLLGFDVSEQTRIATAASEIVRNAFRYARGASVNFLLDESATPQRLIVRVTDQGPGIPHLEDVLAGRYPSSTGMGRGIAGARRLVDRFSIESGPSGTAVVLEKYLTPRHDLATPARAREIAEAVARRRPDGLVEEIQRQNQALLRALEELQRRQQELVELNRELEDTNRGVVALYAELDEKAEHLRHADEVKSRFLSNLTHEFRTPVNSIIGLAALMLDDRDREGRPAEPEIVYIRKAAEQLSELVNDLLDLAKVEAGMSVVRPAEFEVEKLFGALRGMLRPLLLSQSVSLVFDEPAGLPALCTDEGKVSQVLRNLISNALKFTERGEVRVSAVAGDDGTIAFAVRDTGIGIAPEDQSRIFEEFTQIEHALQRDVKGTGLGLSVSRRLAGLLGGTLTIESEPDLGSTFTLTIPMRYELRIEGDEAPRAHDPDRLPLLIIGDAAEGQYVYDKLLRSSAYQLCPAYTAYAADAALKRIDPAAIVCDVTPPAQDLWALLVRLRRTEKTSRTPIVVVGSGTERDKALALGADAYLSKPIDRRRLLDTLTTLQARTARPLTVLVIDDEEVARYLVRQCLPVPAFDVHDAGSGEDGIRQARERRPDVIVLDLMMPGMNGLEVLRQIREDAALGDIPVVILSSQVPGDADRERLLRDADAIISKADLSRESLVRAVRAVEAARPRPKMPTP